MSKTKFINTIEVLKSGKDIIGSIMQDEAGYFHRPKGISGLHKPGKDGEHYPTAKEAKTAQAAGMKSTPAPDKSAPTKPAPQGLKPQPAKPSQETPQKPAQAKETPQATQSPQVSQEASPATAQAGHDKPDPKLIHATISGAKTVAPGEKVKDFVRESLQTIEEQRQAQAPGNASKVRYKLVEVSGPMGLHFWLYAGYQHAKGFKWNGSGGFMFLTLGAVETFLFDNVISLTDDVEKVDISQGSYDPNKGVTPNDDANGQRNLL